MAQILTSIVEADPFGVAGTFDAKDVRLSTLGNLFPGLFQSGDFAVSQRAAGANMSVDIAQGRAFIDPQAATHQGLYLARRTNATAYNTAVDGGMVWTASDATNPRIDILGIQLYDTAEDGSGTTGWKFSVQIGTASASATHQLETLLWPTLPTGFLPLAAILRPAASTTIVTSQISNLNPIGGEGRSPSQYVATAETTTSSSPARLATPDSLMVYVPSSSARVRFGFLGMWKLNASAGTQSAWLFMNSQQFKLGPVTGSAGGAPASNTATVAPLGTFLSRVGTIGYAMTSQAGTGSDVSDVTTGQTATVNSGSPTGFSPLEIFGLPAGWYLFEMKYSTSANTLTVQNRRIWAEVIG